MGRTSKGRRQPYLPPVEKIELSSSHSMAKLAAALILLAVGVAAIAYGVSGLFSAQEGWQQIQASSDQVSCSGDFTLLYDIGGADRPATAEKKALVSLYTDACVRAYRAFDSGQLYDGTGNLASLNRSPNETVTLDEGLYAALERVQAAGDRRIYLGPASRYFENVFACQEDYQTADFDPRQNGDVAVLFQQVAAYAADSAAVDIQLLGGGEARLNVSQAYLAYAQEQEFDCFVDFGWMKNAFIADYLAEELARQGYTNGAISSYDGFVRNLDSRGGDFGVDIYDLDGESLYRAAVMAYTGPMSIVTLRDYPAAEQDAGRFYTFSNGRTLCPYLDRADGLCRAAVSGLTACSDAMGCGELAMALGDVYIADSLDEAALAALEQAGVHTLYCRDGRIVCSGPAIVLQDVYSTEERRYEAVYTDISK